MKIKTSVLVEELVQQTKWASDTVMEFQSMDIETLRFKKTPNQWSILECIEHLNLYGNFYLPEIEKQILAHPPTTEDPTFKSGLIGNYFVDLMTMRNGKTKKMKSPSDMNPMGKVNETTLSRFLKQQRQLLALLEQARQTDLTKTKTAISLTPLIKLRLGDTLRFVVAHIERHVAQAKGMQH